MTRKLIILGSSGLLGSALLQEVKTQGIAHIAISRKDTPALGRKLLCPQLLLDELGVNRGDVVINAIGKTKQLIDLTSQKSQAEAHWLNSSFPHLLAEACDNLGNLLIQVGTDCVFSGASGKYSELDQKDADDFYGVTKASGEDAENLSIIRTSFIGDLPKSNPGLWHWVKSQPKQAEITGYANHFWNGCTVDALSKVLIGAFVQKFTWAGVQHLVPSDWISKFELVELIAKRLQRHDLRINSGAAETPKDMRLATNNSRTNEILWELGGFESPPSISEMVSQQRIYP